MTLPAHRLSGARVDLAQLRRVLGLPTGFDAAVVAEAQVAAAIDLIRRPIEDQTDLPLVTVDPTGAKDLDQGNSHRR